VSIPPKLPGKSLKEKHWHSSFAGLYSSIFNTKVHRKCNHMFSMIPLLYQGKKISTSRRAN
jgi:hypothetical protein